MEEHAYREQFVLEDEHWWFQGRRAVMWSLLRRTGNLGGLRVLDAGCGTGRNLLEFGALGAPGAVNGIDSSPEAIEFCRRRGLDGVVLGRIESLPFGERAFDLLLATDVIEHVEDDRVALRELHRVAAPGGRLLVTVPAYQWLWSQHDDAHHHYRRYTWRRLHARLRETGWEPLAWSYFNSLLLAPIAAVRIAARRRAPTNGRPDLRLTPASINRMLAQPMRLEAALIGNGRHLRAGVSIGVVCAAGYRSPPSAT